MNREDQGRGDREMRANVTDLALNGQAKAPQGREPWGGQSYLQPPFRRLFEAEFRFSMLAERRLKAGGSQDWLPHRCR